MTPTDNKAPREFPEPEPTSSLEYKMLWHSHKELQSRVEKCEGLLRDAQKEILKPTGIPISKLGHELEKYFAEVDGE